MSEENALNVEDDQPAIPEPPVPAPPAPEPPPVASTEGDELDLNAIDVKDEARVRGLIGELSRKRAENRELKGAKERAAQLEAELAEARPYVDFARSNMQALQQRQAPQPPPAPEPQADPDAVEAARLMDFYTADGKPDTERGARWLALQDRRASRVAEQHMAPTVQHGMEQQAAANYQMLRNMKLPDGTPVKQEVVDQIWTATLREPNGIRTLADKASLPILALMAAGAHAMGTRAQPPAPAPALVTEAAGGRATTPQQRLSAIEERTLSQRGMSAAKYTELTKDFKPGVSNVLED